MQSNDSNARLQFSAPVVAQVRKGEVKRPGRSRRGEDIMVVGPDLKDRMRVAFFAGTEEYRQIFIAGHAELANQDPAKLQHLIIHKLHCMIPFPSVWDCLEVYNEAYQANRMVVRATDKQIITKRDPLTGRYLVRDGQPFEAYVPGEPVIYERDGRIYSLPVKTSVRLKLFVPAMGRMVFFEFKSTSFYDSLNLKQQLGGIQLIANMLNGGNAGGIRFFVFRRQQEVCWNKPDGSALRVPHYFLNLEIDPDWVAKAIQRMDNFALTGSQVAGLLMPTIPLEGSEDPTAAGEPPEEGEEDVIDQEPEFEPESQQHPEIDPPVVERADVIDLTAQEVPAEKTEQPTAVEAATPQAVITAAPHDARGALVRPMTPAVLRAALAVKAESSGAATATEKQVNLCRMLIEQTFAGAGQESPMKIRHTVTGYLLGCESLSNATGAQVKALLDWLSPVIKKDTGEYLVDKTAAAELTSVWTAALESAGQMRLF